MKPADSFVIYVVSAFLNFATSIRLDETNAKYGRFFPMQRANGEIEIVDLRASYAVKVDLSDVTYYLITKTNRHHPYLITNGNVSQLNGSPFDSARKSLFIIHGWTGDSSSEVNTGITSAALAKNDLNVFVVDWSPIAGCNYFAAADSVDRIGRYVGEFVNRIQSTYKLTGSSFVLVGNSLGAHVAGNAGATTKSKFDIVGLDPAGPLFGTLLEGKRIHRSHGNFVQIIHTNGGWLGLYALLGHADYFPNGGKKQPGCGLDLIGLCAHERAWEYFAESFSPDGKFWSTLCPSYQKYLRGLCKGNKRSLMGLLVLDRSEGAFFLETSSEKPFARG